MNGVLIRRAKMLDVNMLVELKYRTAGALLMRLGHEVEQTDAWLKAHASIEAVEADVLDHCFILEVDGQPHGMASLRTFEDDDGHLAAKFGSLYVLDGGKGHGSRLMQHRLGAVSMTKAKYVESHIHGRNTRARRFVEHYGFARAGSYLSDTYEAETMIYRLVLQGDS